MTTVDPLMNPGFTVHAPSPAQAQRDSAVFRDLLARLGLAEAVVVDTGPDAVATRWSLTEAALAHWAPGHDTLGLTARGPLGGSDPAHALLAETVLALLASPIALDFPSWGEWHAGLRMRCDIADAARRTTMDFHTARVDRPATHWDYDDDSGFILKPGVDLVDALVQATQPAVSRRMYAFSCYRATEYVMLLGIAKEARRSHPALYDALQRQWRRRAVASGRFHESFLHEWGSNEAPLPMTWYVPGDRVWFRNPDEASSDASGYEGSWVIYLGQGEFANFWKPDQPFDLVRKCIEVYHWRDATWTDAAGELRIDEAVVAQHVARTLADPAATAAVMARMRRYKDGRGIYADGGCMDTTREGPRWVLPGSCDIVLPDVSITGAAG